MCEYRKESWNMDYSKNIEEKNLRKASFLTGKPHYIVDAVWKTKRVMIVKTEDIVIASTS